MARSLKALFPELSAILGTSPDALYGYQRAYVAAGVLTAVPGRGPGSGVRAGPESLSEFLIGMVTHASMEENATLAKALMRARGDCSLTGAKNFGSALARILGDIQTVDRVTEIAIGVMLAQAYIRYDLGEPPGPPPALAQSKSSVFVGPRRSTSAPILFTASIPGSTLKALARVISQ